VAGFVNFSAVCEQIHHDARPVHIICAGTDGEPTLEDTILAGALVDYLSEELDVTLNDSARLAWDAFENHGPLLMEALEMSQGGQALLKLGLREDIRAAAMVDHFMLVPQMKGNPGRIEVGAVGIVRSRWRR
jgi:2-phosphosulfolactate phosphatase